VLAIIVAIRTFLSFSLEVELEGRWPWQRGRPTEPPPARLLTAELTVQCDDAMATSPT